jgi:1-acyl-sn-glycerol-3-phosphate acyltransferase
VNALPWVGASVPRRGSAPTRAFGRALLRLLGWHIAGEVPDLPKFLVAVAPHTSNWDFVVGMAVMFALDLRLTFIGKHTLFRGPLSPILRWMGGIPVDRSSAHGLVSESIAAFAQTDRRILVIAPEGTRARVTQFKSGFLHIARGARVPVLLVAFDYQARCVRFGPWFEPGEDIEAERVKTEAFFAPIRGRRAR